MSNEHGAQPDLETFLRHVLPAFGTYIYAWKKMGDPLMRQGRASDIEFLAGRVKALDAAGFDTYFACASYTGEPIYYTDRGGEQRARYRTAEQALGAQAFWIDMDAGEGKPYTTAGDAAMDLRDWCVEYEVPLPTIVASGSGIHAYWAMNRMVPRAEWLTIAARFKIFLAETELQTDTSRTADIASVLRPPATHNYKRDPAVRIFSSVLREPLSVEQFAARFQSVSLSAVRSAPVSMTLSNLTNIYTEVPAFGARIADACNWVKQVGAVRRGDVSEPLWYAMLGLLVYAVDGEDMAHEWSWGHSDYDYDATEIKMEQVRERQTGPTICSRFESLWREGCRGCPHRGKIITPLQLGRPQPPARAQLASPVDPMLLPPGATPPAPQTANAPLLAFPYIWSPQGALLQSVTDDEGVMSERRLFPYPIFITAMRVGEITQMAFATLKHWAPHDGWREVIAPAGDLTADGAYRTLGNNHIDVRPTLQKAFTLFLSSAKENYKLNRPTDMQHETFGWKAEGFLIGDTLVMPATTGKAGISVELSKYADKLCCKGTLVAWSAAAQQLFRPGYEYQALAILASLAAPLMRFAPYPGTIYSIVHPQSGRGKTLAVEGANSIWGDEQSLWISHRDERVTTGDTIKSQYRAMALFKSLPVIIDEMRETDPEKLRGFILAFTDGSPPKGLNRDGSMRPIFGKWETVMITSSNKSMVDVVTVNNDPAAASRVFEVTAELPADAIAKVGDALRRDMLQNCGHAGIRFVQELMKPERFTWAQDLVAQRVALYTADLQAQREEKSGGDRYSASFLACCSVAAELASSIGLLDCPFEPIREWALDRWSAQRTQIDQSRRTAIEGLSAFIREFWLNALVVDDEPKGRENAMVGRHVVRAPIVMRQETKTGRLLLDRNKMHAWCLEQNLHFNGFAQDLERAGVLLDRNAYKNMGAGTEYRGVGQARVWVLDGMHPDVSGELRDMASAPRGEPVAVRKIGAV